MPRPLTKIKLYAFLSALCLAPRLLYLFFRPYSEDLTSSYYYWKLSSNLLRYGILSFNGTKTTEYEPLYPFFLASARWITHDHIFLVFLLQIMIGIIGCLYFYELSRLLSRNKYVGLIASLLYSLYPYLVYQTSRVIEITLLSTLLIVSAYHYCKASNLKNSISCGIFLGLTLLTRTTTLPILFLAVTALLVRKFYRQAFLVTGMALFVFLPMIIRNYQIDGSLFPTRSGVPLFSGNSEYSDKLIPAYSLDLLGPHIRGLLRKERPDLIQSDDKKKDQFFTQKALQFMKEHPWRIVKLKLKNIFYLFHPRIIPFHPMSKNSKLILNETGDWHVENAASRSFLQEFIHSFFYGFILLTALIGIYLRRKEFRTDLILYLITLSFIAALSLYYPTTRQRAPTDFVLMFYSACAIEPFLRRLKMTAWI